MEDINSLLKRGTERLKEIRESTGLNQKQFAEMFGVNPTTYNRYESGEIGNMPRSLIGAISKKYNINPSWLMGYESVTKYFIRTKVNTKSVPIYGTIAAGVPILASEDLFGYEEVPETSHIDFCLRVKGDSMIGARILDGDLVYIRQQPDVENGEIAAVLIDNEEATLKRVYKINGSIILRSENPAYQDLVFNKKETRDIKIIGKAIMFKSEVR